MSLSMKTQVAAAIEDLEGVAETLTAADLTEVFHTPLPRATARFGKVDRPIAVGNLTRQAPVRGGTDDFALSLTMELAGPKDGNPATEPQWSRYLRACGMRRVAAKVAAIAATFTTGDKLEHNWVFEADSTGAQGRVLGSWYEGEDLMVIYEPVPFSGAIGGGDSSISVTIDSVVVAQVNLTSPGTLSDAQVWEPYDDRVSQISVGAVTDGPINIGDELLGATSGARARAANQVGAPGGTLKLFTQPGSAAFQNGESISVVGGTAVTSASSTQAQVDTPSLTMDNGHDHTRIRGKGVRGSWNLTIRPNEQALLNFEMQGAALAVGDQALFDWPGLQQAVGPTVKGSELTLDGSHVPVWDSVEVRSGNSLVPRPNQGDSTGVNAVRITDRNHTTTFGAELVREAIYPTFTRARDKAAVRLKHVIGSVPGNTFEIRQRALHFDDAQIEDASSLLNRSVTAEARAGDDGSGNDETIIILR